jgi:lysophospholipase L1-like esterase
MLGDGYDVGNFGAASSTVLFNTENPYIYQNASERAREFLPDITIIMLGTNDARTDYYLSIDNFVADYEILIEVFQAVASKPKIFLVKPPPIFNNDLNLSSTNLLEGVIPRVQQVANALNLPTIDVYTPLANHPEYFVDGVHPNNEGAQKIGSEVYNAIISNRDAP